MADEMQRIFEEAGYTYPGSPEAGARLLLSEVQRSQHQADAESRKYSVLVSELNVALDASPLQYAPGDPVRHIALLCERVQERHVAAITNAVRTLRARHPRQSEAHRDDDEFLFAMDELGDAEAVGRLIPIIEASVAYWQALQRGDDHASVAAVLTRWSQAVSTHLESAL